MNNDTDHSQIAPFIHRFGERLSQQIASGNQKLDSNLTFENTDNLLAEVGYEIRLLREYRGFTRQQLADKATVERVFISLIENRGIGFEHELLKQIDDLIIALHQPAHALLSGQDVDQPQKRIQQQILLLQTIRKQLQQIEHAHPEPILPADLAPEKPTDDIVSFLKTVFPFSEIKRLSDLIVIAKEFETVSYNTDDIVFKEDDQSNDLYVVMKGYIHLFSTSLSGKATTVDILSTGDVLGEFAAIDGGLRSATAIVTQPCKMYKMSGERYQTLIRNIPDLSIGISKLLTQRLRLTNRCIANIAQSGNLEGKLKYILYRNWVARKTTGLQKGLPFQAKDLAEMLGTSTQQVQQILDQWENDGLIQFKRCKIIIPNIIDFIAEVASRDWFAIGAIEDLNIDQKMQEVASVL